jgi:hypothetical protein
MAIHFLENYSGTRPHVIAMTCTLRRGGHYASEASDHAMKILHTATLLLLIAVAPACGSQLVEFGHDDSGGVPSTAVSPVPRDWRDPETRLTTTRVGFETSCARLSVEERISVCLHSEDRARATTWQVVRCRSQEIRNPRRRVAKDERGLEHARFADWRLPDLAGLK